MTDETHIPIPAAKPDFQPPTAAEMRAAVEDARQQGTLPQQYDEANAPYSNESPTQICEDCPRPYVLFIGGFMDKINKNVYSTYLDYKEIMDDQLKLQYVYYQEHAPWYTGFARDLNLLTHGGKAYHTKFKRTVVIIAHSWGCTTAMRLIADKLLPTGMKVRLLVTCDPVGNINAMKRPPNVQRWRNIYVDYEIEGNRIYHDGMRPTANGIALIDKYVKIPGTLMGMKGGPLGPTVQADVNEPFIQNGSIATHPDAHGYFGEMFKQAQAEVQAIR